MLGTVTIVITVITGHSLLAMDLWEIYQLRLLYAIEIVMGHGAYGALGFCHSFLVAPLDQWQHCLFAQTTF